MACGIRILGSGTVVPDHRHLPAAYLLEADDLSVLLDCGPGTLIRFSELGLSWQDLSHVLLTHHHEDHVGGLPWLFQAWKYGMEPPRTEPLRVVGPTGTRTLLEGMEAMAPHAAGLETFTCDVRELGEGEVAELGPFRATAHPTPHTPESVAYRIDTPDGAVGFTGDTGASEEVAAFLSGCAVVVAECSWRDPLPVPMHLSPGTLAEMARVMRPQLLVLTHVYPTHMTPEQAVERVAAAGYPGWALAARDGMVLSVVEGSVTVDPGGTRQ